MALYTGPVIDTHHHIWEIENYPWLLAPPSPKLFGDYEKLRHDYPVETFIDDVKNQNVAKSVHIQANWDFADPAGETRWLQSVAERAGFPHGIIAYADLTKPDEAEALIAEHLKTPNMRGIRQQLFWHEEPLWRACDRPDLASSAEFKAGFKLLGKYGLSFELQMFPFHAPQLESVAELLAENPEVPVVLVHAGMLPLDRPEFRAPWRAGLERLAGFANLWVKLSGLAILSQRWTKAELRGVIAEALEVFGAGRTFYGSNFPLERMWASYDEVCGATREILAELLSEADQRKVLHDNAVEYDRL